MRPSSRRQKAFEDLLPDAEQRAIFKSLHYLSAAALQLLGHAELTEGMRKALASVLMDISLGKDANEAFQLGSARKRQAAMRAFREWRLANAYDELRAGGEKEAVALRIVAKRFGVTMEKVRAARRASGYTRSI